MNTSIRLGIAFPKITLASPKANLNELKDILQEANEKELDLLLFPALSLTGDGLGELNRHPVLLDGCKEVLEELKEEATFPVLIGSPIEVHRRIFSTLALLAHGEIKGYFPLSSKDKIFSDPLLFPEELLPCRDLYHIAIHMDDDFSTPGKEEEIIHALTTQEKQGQVQIYLSSPESYTTSGGIHSSRYLVLQGEKVIAHGQWEQGLNVLKLDVEKASLEVQSYERKEERSFSPHPFLSPNPVVYEELLLHQARAYGHRLNRTGSKHSILGISGGLDSTWALIATIHAHKEMGLPLDNIHPIILPGFGSSEDTMRSALDLLDALQLKPEIISIEKAVLGHFGDIGHDPENHNVVYENAQARERTQVLMDLANGYGGLVVGTGDMSEIALGWSTYNGDQMSMYGLNAGLPKTLIQDLILWYAKKEGGKLEEALLHILGRPISPELLPPDKKGRILQKTEEILGKYEVIDFILYHTLCYRPLAEIFNLMGEAFPSLSHEEKKESLLRFYKRFISQQFKRTASPDGVKLTEPSLVGFSMAGDLSSTDFVKEIEAL